jgi:hypothetical protein
MDKAPEMFNVPDFKLESILKLSDYDIEHIDNKTLIKSHKLYIAHGDEFFGAGSINVARNVRLKTNENIAFGHFHFTQEDTFTAISNKIYGSFAIGCLCGLKPFYAPVNRWNHGFAIVEYDDDGNFEFHNKRIIAGGIK